MADLEAIVLIAGEVRAVEVKRDFVDKQSGEVTPANGKRTLSVLTYGGFVSVSVPGALADVEFTEGQVILAKAKVLPWTMAGRPKGDGTSWPEKHGTAFIYEGPITADELDALNKAGAIQHPVKA